MDELSQVMNDKVELLEKEIRLTILRYNNRLITAIRKVLRRELLGSERRPQAKDRAKPLVTPLALSAAEALPELRRRDVKLHEPVAAPLPEGLVIPDGADAMVVPYSGTSRFVGVPGRPPALRVNRATLNDFGRQAGDAAHACCSWIDDTPRTEREILAVAGYTRPGWSQMFRDLIDEGHVRLGGRRVCQVSKREAKTYVRSRRTRAS